MEKQASTAEIQSNSENKKEYTPPKIGIFEVLNNTQNSSGLGFDGGSEPSLHS